MRVLIGPKLLLALALLGADGAAARTTLTLSTGAEYSSGDYGETSETEVLAVPLAVRVRKGDWALRVSAPYLRITGPADVADFSDTGGGGGGGSSPGDSGGAFTRSGTQSGIGDTTISLSRTLHPFDDHGAYVEAIGRVRLPTGDEGHGLGTGATDYMLGGELGVSSRGGGAYLGIQRRFLGQPESGIERDAGWLINAGGWRRVAEGWALGGFATWREATKQGRDDPAEVGGYLWRDLSEHLRLTVSAGAGLNDASPDWTSGFRLAWRTDLSE